MPPEHTLCAFHEVRSKSIYEILDAIHWAPQKVAVQQWLVDGCFSCEALFQGWRLLVWGQLRQVAPVLHGCFEGEPCCSAIKGRRCLGRYLCNHLLCMGVGM